MDPHGPFILNRNLERPRSKREENEIEQTRGAYQIVDAYIAELKRLGLYENTSIIVTADHGRWYLTPNDITGHLLQQSSINLLVQKRRRSRTKANARFQMLQSGTTISWLKRAKIWAQILRCSLLHHSS